MMLLSVVVSPLAVWLTSGKKRLIALGSVLICGAAFVVAVPHVAAQYAFATMCAFQTFQLASYAISDAAMLERVDPSFRGRVVGLFLTIAGTAAGLGPWVMGWWTDTFGRRAAETSAYAGPLRCWPYVCASRRRPDDSWRPSVA